MISSRLNPWWKVVATHQTADEGHCIDIFTRPDRTFGFAAFDRDPDDAAKWRPVGGFTDQQFTSAETALAAARQKVGWLSELLEANQGAPAAD
ncbi:MAG: hypothetical protein ACRDY2_12635 [Acidimicrobiales bacterium]